MVNSRFRTYVARIRAQRALTKIRRARNPRAARALCSHAHMTVSVRAPLHGRERSERPTRRAQPQPGSALQPRGRRFSRGRRRTRRAHVREGDPRRVRARLLSRVRAHRARSAGAPLAGDAADAHRARRQARLLPVVRVPDRTQPGPVPDEHGPVRGGGRAGGGLRLRSGRDPRVRGRSRASATAASGGSPPASWTRWRRWSCPRSATASATSSASSSSASTDGHQVEQRDDWLQLGNPWELPRHEDAQTVRFGGRVEMHHDARRPPARRTGSTRATVIGVPYDSFIVGYRTDTVNTLRLWAARATRDFDLQLFNDGDYRRAVEEKIDTENISKVLYPNDQTDEGKELRLKQQYFFVACSIADIVRRFKKLHTDFDAVPRQGRDPAQRHPPRDRRRRADARAGRRGAAGLGRGLGDHRSDARLHQPHAAARGAGALAGGAVRAAAAAAPADHLRDQPALPAPGADALAGRRRAAGAHVASSRRAATSRSAWRTWPPSARTASTASPSCTRDLVKTRRCCRDFDELWPERFNNKTNGVTPRRWLLHAQPAADRA